MRFSTLNLLSENLDANTVTNLFLYGTTSAPDRLFDRVKTKEYLDSLPVLGFAKVPAVIVDVDAAEFLEKGAGRFAVASMNDVVSGFFELPDILVAPGLDEDFSTMAQRLNFPFDPSLADESDFSFEHFLKADGQDDVPDRPYVFGNSSYTLDSNMDEVPEIRFKVLADGSRVIENIRVLPYDDNFDFDGGSVASGLFNFFFEDVIDPYGIGTRVEFEYNIVNAPTYSTYTREDYLRDVAFDNETSTLEPITSPFDSSSDLVASLEASQTLLYKIDEFSVMYGDPTDQTLNARDRVGIDDTDGALILAGEGGDTLIGSDGQDRLYGHQDNDRLFGNLGDDLLFGGSGADTLQGGAGNDVLFGDHSDEDFNGAEELEGERGADSLYGGLGDDIIYFDAEDTVVLGGEEEDDRDVGFYVAADAGDGLTANADDLELEVLFGGAGDDELTGFNGVRLAGGDGDDTFMIKTDYTWDRGADYHPTLIWGGDGADRINIDNAVIVTVQAEMDEQAFIDFELSDLGFDDVIDWNWVDVVLFNPDADDRIETNLHNRDHPDFDPADTYDISVIYNLDDTGYPSDYSPTVDGSYARTEEPHPNLSNQLVLTADISFADDDDRLPAQTQFQTFDGGVPWDRGYGFNAAVPIEYFGLFSLIGAEFRGPEGKTLVGDGLGGYMYQFGSGQDDMQNGGPGSDGLSGGGGNDTFRGGGGNDRMTGGSGADIFLFDSGDGQDVIADFLTEDTITIDGEDVDFLAPAPGIVVERDGFDTIIRYGADDSIQLVDFVVEQPDNVAPVLNTPIQDVQLEDYRFFNFSIPTDMFSDPNGDPLALTATLADGSALPDWITFSEFSEGTFRIFYLPGSGTVNVIVTAFDGILETTDQFTIGPVGANLTPIAIDDGPFDVLVYDTLSLPAATLLLNDTDPDGDALTVTSVSDGFGGAVSFDNGILTYVPLPGFSGTDQISYTISDGQNTSTAQISINVSDPTEVSKIGTDQKDILVGNGQGELIVANDGDDIVNGKGGDDVILGGDGDDIILTGRGDDIARGGAGDDFILGGFGNNVLSGGDGNDTLRTGQGDDTLDGGAGDDTLTGGDGNDIFIGGTGDDLMIAGFTNPFGNSDTFVFRAGDGNDQIDGFRPNQLQDDGSTLGDLIELTITGIDSFADIQNVASTQGSDLVFDFGSNGSLRLTSVDLADLGADQFAFV